MANLREVNVTDFIHSNFLRESEDTYVSGIILTAKRHDRPLQTFRPNVGRVKKTSMDSSYDRLVIIGELQSAACFAVITTTAQESSSIFRHPLLSVGALVHVHEPIFSGLCLGNDRSNPIFEVRRPLELAAHNGMNLRPSPIVINPLTTALTKFQLNNTQLSFIQTNIASPTCSGVFCDRRIVKSSNCACIQKSAVSAWAISCRIFSTAIDNVEEDPLSGEVLQSLQLNKIFCSTGTLALPATDIVVHRLRQCVRNIQQYVNDNGGWLVTGYYKSGLSEENIAQTISRVQICRIRATVMVPDDRKYDVGQNNHDDNPPPPLRPAGHD